MTLGKKLLAIILFVVIVGALFIYSGVYDVSATNSHWPITRWMLHTVQEQSVNARVDEIDVPESLNKDQQAHIRGAKIYGEVCQMCHLGPGVRATALYQGLMPVPPDLQEVAAHHTPEYLFQATKHGIRMTGMPAWGETYPDKVLWDLVAFMQRMPRMTSEEYEQLTLVESNAISE